MSGHGQDGHATNAGSRPDASGRLGLRREFAANDSPRSIGAQSNKRCLPTRQKSISPHRQMLPSPRAATVRLSCTRSRRRGTPWRARTRGGAAKPPPTTWHGRPAPAIGVTAMPDRGRDARATALRGERSLALLGSRPGWPCSPPSPRDSHSPASLIDGFRWEDEHFSERRGGRAVARPQVESAHQKGGPGTARTLFGPARRGHRASFDDGEHAATCDPTPRDTLSRIAYRRFRMRA